MYYRISRPWALAALSGLFLMAACTDTSTLPSEVEVQLAKGGNGGKPGGGGGGEDPPPLYEMSMFDNLDARISDISDTDVGVGSFLGEPALVDLSSGATTPLLGCAAEFCWVARISDQARFAVGNYSAGGPSPFDGQGLVWDVRGGEPVVGEEVVPIDGRPTTLLYGINDAGVAAGQSWGPEQRDVMPAVWGPDGSGSLLPLLGDSYTKGDALGINNANINNAIHVVGRNQTDAFNSGHAVMWTLNVDGPVDIVDLTPLADGTGDNLASRITKPTNDGIVQILGGSTIAGVRYKTLWTVDVSGPKASLVGSPRLSPEESGVGFGGDFSVDGANGFVQDVILSKARVWNLVDDVVHELPGSGTNCSRIASAFDSSGRIFGWSEVSTKKSARCGLDDRAVIKVPVIWTKIENLP